MSDLIALLDSNVMGRLAAGASGRMQFIYDDTWCNDPLATPLSLSLPIAAERHDGEPLAAVLWGLLPDNENTLRRWATRFHVSARNVLGLLANVGEDCAGAVQFVRPERVDAILRGDEDGVRWLDDDEIELRLRHLRTDSGAARELGDAGQFSLAGAQAKTAFHYDFRRNRWGVPRGRTPTTHILKPPSGEFEGYAENEHFCLLLGRALGLSVAASSVVRFGDELAICVERYDRERTDAGFVRVHQEDFCQALGIHPADKYQNEGGPAAADLAGILRRHSTRPQEDCEVLFFALVFNWFIAGTDAHAKNYSLLLGHGGRARLAPLYDLSSAHPYPSLAPRKIKLAMKIGGHYRWWDISLRDWLATAAQLSVDSEQALALLRSLAGGLPDFASSVAGLARENGVDHPVIDRIVDGIASASQRMMRALDARQP